MHVPQPVSRPPTAARSHPTTRGQTQVWREVVAVDPRMALGEPLFEMDGKLDVRSFCHSFRLRSQFILEYRAGVAHIAPDTLKQLIEEEGFGEKVSRPGLK